MSPKPRRNGSRSLDSDSITTVVGYSLIKIFVRDTGLGIPPDQVANIFTPFDRLGAERTTIEGTGLGLALSKHLTEMMRGKLSFESSPEGTTFFVDLELPNKQTDVRPLAA